MSRRLINEPHQAKEPQARELDRVERERRELWRVALGTNAGQFICAQILNQAMPHPVSTGNSDTYKNAALVDFAHWLEEQIGTADLDALIAIRAALIRVRFGKRNHEESHKKESHEEET